MKKMLLSFAALFAAATTALAAEYAIGTLAELREFMEAVHMADFAGDTITLTADIDCEGGRFNTGAPEYPSTFRGTFDGGGHVISNFVHQSAGGGFAGYVSSSARIATSWCFGPVTGYGSYCGAFVGQANSGLVTGSYYDTGANYLMEAVGTSSSSSSTAYAGITPLDDEEMQQKESFAAFDFDDVWKINEETTPYLRTFFSAYELWLKDAGITYEPEPEDMVDGIPAGIRYVYNIPAEATSLYALVGEEFFHVVMDVYGNPCVKFRAKRDPRGGVDAVETVYATTDLADMADPDPANWPHRVQMRYDVLDDTWKPANGVCPPAMFFRWRIELEREENAD